MQTLTMEKAKSLLPKRKTDSNKGTYGKLLIIAGKKECAGCAILSSMSAMRMGLGMVKVISAKSNFTALMNYVPETLFSSKADDESLKKSVSWADAILIGPGIGTGKKAEKLLAFCLETRGIPLVIDADGINLLAHREYLRDMLHLKAAEDQVIITPHLMEMSRFTGLTAGQIKEDMAGTALKYASEYQMTVALKDATTVTASSDGRLVKNTTGNNGMSTAGSGDVLAGIIASLLAQRMNAFDAASVGVYLHGAAGDIAAERFGVRGMMARDEVEALVDVLR